jgi:subtilisin family serine protease
LIGDSGHGTAVSVLAVAGSDQLSLIPIRHNLMGQASDDIKAIEYAAKRNARVINMSYGYGGTDTQQDIMQVCAAIRAHGDMLFVVATDDNHLDNDRTPSYPAGCAAPNLIAVGSVGGFFDIKSLFSGYGKNSVQIAAKGEKVPVDLGYGSTGTESGTSFAAPQVANVAGKILVANPSLTPSEVIKILVNSSSKRPWLKNYFQSHGVLNEGHALEMAKKTVGK